MNLTEIITNPEIVKAYFTFDPNLNGINLHEINIHRDGPTAKLRFDLSEFPDKPPRKWHSSYNTAQMTISLIDIEQIQLNGFNTTETGNLSFALEKEKILFSFKSKTCSFNGKCSFINVEKISGYVNAEQQH